MSDASSNPTVSGSTTLASGAKTVAGGAPSESPSRRRLVRGDLVGRYVVLEILGRGGMGVVYSAYDPQLDRKIALKLLLPGRDRSSAARARLQREAQAIARLSHPNVVTVHDVGAVDDQVFIAMEFVDGVDLAHWLARPRSERKQAEVIEHFVQAGTGLVAAHRAGLVHRDFKPENVLLGADGRARVVDFGLVRADESSAHLVSGAGGDEIEEFSQGGMRASSQLSLTHAGEMMGTPAYMSPEQFSGLPGDARSDQFSFCVALYEGLYGERPFAGSTPLELCHAVTGGEVSDPPARHRVSGALRRVLLRGLSVEPDDRYPGMGALLAALRRASAPRRRRWIWPGALGLLAVGLGGWWLRSDDQPASRCDELDGRVEVLWNARRRSALEEAFGRTDRPFAAQTWQRVDAHLDAHFERWAEIRRQVCEETVELDPVAADSDRRFQCLEHRLSEVEDLLSVLDRVDGSMVADAVQMVHGLTSLEECTGFDGDSVLPEPSDPRLRDEVRAQRSEHRRWTLEASRNTEQEVREELDAFMARAKETNYLPLLAEVLEIQAEDAGSRGDLDRAVELSNRAFETALQCRHDYLAINVGADLVFLHGVQRDEPSLGHDWARRTQALQLRVGSGLRSRLKLASAWASVHARAEEDAEAQRLYDEALSLARELGDPIHLATILNNIGGLHATFRRIGKARSYLEEAAGINAATYGSDHPSTLRTEANLGILAVIDGQYDEGLERLEAVLPRQEAVMGRSDSTVANTLQSMANALTQKREFTRALALRRRVLEIREGRHGPDGRGTLSSRLGLANTLMYAGKVDEVESLLTDLAPRVDRLPDPDLTLKFGVTLGLAWLANERARVETDAEARVSEYERAIEYAEQARRICEELGDSCHSGSMGSTMTRAAWSRLHLGRLERARESFEEVLSLPASERPSWLEQEARFGLARVLAFEDRPAAIAQVKRLLPRLTATDPATVRVAEEMGQWLEEQEADR